MKRWKGNMQERVNMYVYICTWIPHVLGLYIAAAGRRVHSIPSKSSRTLHHSQSPTLGLPHTSVSRALFVLFCFLLLAGMNLHHLQFGRGSIRILPSAMLICRPELIWGVLIRRIERIWHFLGCHYETATEPRADRLVFLSHSRLEIFSQRNSAFSSADLEILIRYLVSTIKRSFFGI